MVKQSKGTGKGNVPTVKQGRTFWSLARVSGELSGGCHGIRAHRCSRIQAEFHLGVTRVTGEIREEEIYLLKVRGGVSPG